jgi:hypothetical protein
MRNGTRLIAAPDYGLDEARQEFDRAWAVLGPAAARYATHTKESVWLDVANGRAQLWVRPDAACITVPNISPLRRTLELWLAGGQMAGILAGEEDIADYAREKGFTHFTLIGRPGWARALSARGYEPEAVLLTRTL